MEQKLRNPTFKSSVWSTKNTMIPIMQLSPFAWSVLTSLKLHALCCFWGFPLITFSLQVEGKITWLTSLWHQNISDITKDTKFSPVTRYRTVIFAFWSWKEVDGTKRTSPCHPVSSLPACWGTERTDPKVIGGTRNTADPKINLYQPRLHLRELSVWFQWYHK